MSGTLYLVGTPIGNLGDLSVRALETLRSADFIAAEDTRVTAKLLNHFEIKKPCVSYYEHNKYASGEKIVARLLAGETCALVTDAGMPAISDPGEDIVRQCAEQGIDVQVIPGPCAAIAALAVSGLPTQQFCFEGFLAVSGKTRREHLERLRGETRTMIFYEAPHKLLRTLCDLRDTFGGAREITLARELTKLHEQKLRTTLDGAVAYFTETPPKGEFVLVLRGAPERSEPVVTAEQALDLYENAIVPDCADGTMGRAWLTDSGTRQSTAYAVTIGYQLSQYDPATGETTYADVDYTPLTDSTRTLAWLRAHGIEPLLEGDSVKYGGDADTQPAINTYETTDSSFGR